MGLAPERDASRLPTSPARLEGAPEAALDGTERRRQCPPDAQWHKEHYSGKKKTHTEKNLLLGNERTAIPADGLIVNGLLALWPSMVLYDRSARHPIAYDSSCMRA